MADKRFENRLDKSNKKFNVLNPCWDNEHGTAINVFEMIDLLNELNDKNKELESKIMELIQYYQDEEIHATESWYELICSAKQEVLHELLTETGH